MKSILTCLRNLGQFLQAFKLGHKFLHLCPECLDVSIIDLTPILHQPKQRCELNQKQRCYNWINLRIVLKRDIIPWNILWQLYQMHSEASSLLNTKYVKRMWTRWLWCVGTSITSMLPIVHTKSLISTFMLKNLKTGDSSSTHRVTGRCLLRQYSHEN